VVDKVAEVIKLFNDVVDTYRQYMLTVQFPLVHDQSSDTELLSKGDHLIGYMLDNFTTVLPTPEEADTVLGPNPRVPIDYDVLKNYSEGLIPIIILRSDLINLAMFIKCSKESTENWKRFTNTYKEILLK